MSPAEICAELKRISGRLGSEGRASIVFLCNSDGLAHASIESTWRTSENKMEHRASAETFEQVFAALEAQVDLWIDEAPMRNRVATAADLGLDAAA